MLINESKVNTDFDSCTFNKIEQGFFFFLLQGAGLVLMIDEFVLIYTDLYCIRQNDLFTRS